MINLKRGQKINVILTETHELGGSVHHPARFVRMLLDSQWAEVELEEEHAGGTRALHVPLSAIETADSEATT